ncbi:enoyl-CoA hydratase/isomerase family protein [Eggerthella sp. YY7918]|uniref:enoyl-CoA hydratase/isomerase family protein n=1 Tax=Eggerthella sp. (strain YY7918) TaxID=502558 RepID=UPI000217192A|nr:enoyl-CoA hydratase/isomerase family protein [Eggerthella sp. YY7918]BAK44623.1 enoyl-CoA hydratase [Eggerthella sp. YY7918]
MGLYQEKYHVPEFKYDEYEFIKITKDGPVYICTLNDPDNLNAMSYAQMAEFNEFLVKVRMDHECRVIVLTGEGRAFCAGFNLNDLSMEHPDDMGDVQTNFYIMQRICSDQAVYMHRCEQPIIGALKGYAVGGGLSLACACDMRILGESFKMNAGYLAVGLTGTDMSGSFYLPKIVGYERAFRILSSPDRWDAKTLSSWGFGLEVVPDDEVVSKAVELAHHICDTTSPLGLRLTKEAMHTSIDGTSFETQIKVENRNQVLGAVTQDGFTGRAKMHPKNKEDVKAHPENYVFKNL